ncbi:MAG TPA: Gfo/Idh/MocA family oxidoreductase [Spirochaetales bacterium]|nr:Gfo/Idh/MocA family oxidoreductase [Spirochaetales bacterium]HOV38008.1 Gfo/Idh/MocA family oxidoreductase [Spirochaetales bacterium]
MKPITIALVGIGGYGENYVQRVLEEGQNLSLQLVGAIDPHPDSCQFLSVLQNKQVPLFPSLEEFYKQQTADLVVISTPIQYHFSQSEYSLLHGSHVLCEKPLCATVRDALQLRKTRDTMGKQFAVGFQWAYDDAFIKLKEDVLAGRLGEPLRLRSLVLWPRDEKYFARPWAGKIKAPDGTWILDSVANNAAAHFLHAMLHLLGDSMETSTFPAEVTAELYRANPIENYDTGTFRIVDQKNREILFFASHAIKNTYSPMFRFEFEEGTVVFNDPWYPENSGNLLFYAQNGKTIEYGNPNHLSLKKLDWVVQSLQGIVRIPCSIESALSHTLCIEAGQKSVPVIQDFPPELVRVEKEQKLRWIEGLEETLFRCFDSGKLPKEAGAPWAREGKTVSIQGKDIDNIQIIPYK